jgi:pimeloyl-ACP methyl ester carboxylesterase
MDQTLNGINFKTYGKNHGYALVFLHGYLESSQIWNDFAGLFSDEYFVVCIDLPGHGKSAVTSGESTMEMMGNAVISVTDHLGIGGFHLVGHSMGGYVAMSMLEHHSDRLNSVVLFHSTCFADSEEKRTNRDREIELVRQGKKEIIVNTSIPRLFAYSNLEEMLDSVENSKKIALVTSDAGIISALTAMKMRPDRSKFLADSEVPILLIGGRKDNLIPYEIMEKMKTLSSHITQVCLENSGHMGFVEETEQSSKELRKFFDASFECL